MRSLHLPVDHAGRLILEIYVGVGEALANALRLYGTPIPVPRQIKALIDTGASKTVIEEGHLRNLGLSPVGETNIYTVSTGSEPLKRHGYTATISLAGDVTGTLAKNLYVVAVKDLSGMGVQALLGRDVLAGLYLSYRGPEGEFYLELPEQEDDSSTAAASSIGPTV